MVIEQEVSKAMKLEIDYLRHMGVYNKVHIHAARQEGHNILGVRWVGVKKADGTQRSQLVATDIKTYNAPELFAATLTTI